MFLYIKQVNFFFVHFAATKMEPWTQEDDDLLFQHKFKVACKKLHRPKHQIVERLQFLCWEGDEQVINSTN